MESGARDLTERRAGARRAAGHHAAGVTGPLGIVSVALWQAGRTMAGPSPADVLGRVTLVTGKEEFLNERTVAAVRDAVRRHDARGRVLRDPAAPT